jgi:hypothetical protein
MSDVMALELAAWSSRDWTDGVNITRLSPCDQLTVTTRNSVYTIVVVRPSTAEVQVRGGVMFPAFTTVRLCGSSLGSAFLKRHVVHPGFCLEFADATLGRVITTRVREVVSDRTDRPPTQAVM